MKISNLLNKYKLLIGVFIFIALIVVIVVRAFQANDPGRQIASTLLDVLINLAAAYIFFLLVDYSANNTRKKIVRNNFRDLYIDFKKEVIHLLLRLADLQDDTGKIDELVDPGNFTSYFYDPDPRQDDARNHRMYSVMNGMENPENKSLLDDLLVELHLFREQVLVLLTKVEFEDKQILELFTRVSQVLYRNRSVGHAYNNVKYLTQFLGGWFGGFDLVEGQHSEDKVLKAIEKL